MQIVINLSDSVYDAIKNKYTLVNPKEGTLIKTLWDAINDGIPLPKGHGRLIDADEFLKDNEAYTGWILDSSDWGGENAYKDTLEDLVNDADTIIEADRKEV